MVFFNEEGRFNDFIYHVDGILYGLKGTMSVYIIERGGERLMVDTSEKMAARKIHKKLQALGIAPVQKIFLTHSHWDHVAGSGKFRKLMAGETDIDIYASEAAIDNLKHPDKMNAVFGRKLRPIDDVIPLKDGDAIDLGGLELVATALPGHTTDSMGLLEKESKVLFAGDALIDRTDRETFLPTYMPPDFHEGDIQATFQKVRDMRERGDIEAVALAHCGIWAGADCDRVVGEMEDLHFKTKEAIIRWYRENPDPKRIALKYMETFIPGTHVHSKENIMGLEMMVKDYITSMQLLKWI